MTPTTVRRKRADKIDPTSTFSEHIVLKRQASTVSTRANALKDRLKRWFLEEAGDETYANEQGSRFYDFSETVSDGKEDYRGMELRRSVSPQFDEDEATKILKRKGVYEQALTPVLDQDKIFRLLQEGALTDKDIDKMFTDRESFAFWPVKGQVL